jgi:hypothetical protein
MRSQFSCPAQRIQPHHVFPAPLRIKKTGVAPPCIDCFAATVFLSAAGARAFAWSLAAAITKE